MSLPPMEAMEAELRNGAAAWKQGMIGAINVFAMILAARLIVLVAVGGGILLTWVGLENPDPYRLAALGTYCVAVVVPCVWLASRGR